MLFKPQCLQIELCLLIISVSLQFNTPLNYSAPLDFHGDKSHHFHQYGAHHKTIHGKESDLSP